MDRTFMKLVSQDQIGPTVLAIERAVAQSFAEDGSRMTQSEIRRRFGVCERLLRHLRGDLGWAMQRVLDHLPRYLRCELDAVPWKPEARVVWAPEQPTDAGKTGGRK